ncbi:hypothetical protein LP414_27450 [Polaromonas sp. P1(28)-13]|nr:hypothetical protein LP414_27450 [Polaromonas sp. P1(28)-13]
MFSNGIWFISNVLLIGFVAKPGMSWQVLAPMGAIYIAGTVTGAVLMHYIALRYLETGKRKVGG